MFTASQQLCFLFVIINTFLNSILCKTQQPQQRDIGIIPLADTDEPPTFTAFKAKIMAVVQN